MSTVKSVMPILESGPGCNVLYIQFGHNMFDISVMYYFVIFN